MSKAPVLQSQSSISVNKDRKRKRAEDPGDSLRQVPAKVHKKSQIEETLGTFVGAIKKLFTQAPITTPFDSDSDDDPMELEKPSVSRSPPLPEPAAKSAFAKPPSSSSEEKMADLKSMPPPPSRKPVLQPPSPRLRSFSFNDVYVVPQLLDRDKLRALSSRQALLLQSRFGLLLEEDVDILSGDDASLDQMTGLRWNHSDSEEYRTFESEDGSAKKNSVMKQPRRRLYDGNVPLAFLPDGDSPARIAAARPRARRNSSPGDLPSVPIDVESYRPAANQIYRDVTRKMLEYEQSILPSITPAILNDDLLRAAHIRSVELLQPLRQLAAEQKRVDAQELRKVKEKAHKEAELNAIRLKQEEIEAALKAEEEERMMKEALIPAGAPSLTEEESELVRSAFKRRDSEILADKFNIEVKGEHIKTLRPGGWLNDEIINFYMELLSERCKNDPTLPRCHFFNSFFYKLLSKAGEGYDFPRVQTWTKRFDMFTLDKVIAPIHLGNHWCLAAIDMKKKRFEYYDSMGGTNPECIQILQRYIVDEYKRKRNQDLNIDEWTVYTPGRQVPQQRNGSDCGVFTCRFADCSASNRMFRFSQADMELYRRSMVVEVLQAKLRTHPVQ